MVVVVSIYGVWDKLTYKLSVIGPIYYIICTVARHICVVVVVVVTLLLTLCIGNVLKVLGDC